MLIPPKIQVVEVVGTGKNGRVSPSRGPIFLVPTRLLPGAYHAGYPRAPAAQKRGRDKQTM